MDKKDITAGVAAALLVGSAVYLNNTTTVPLEPVVAVQDISEVRDSIPDVVIAIDDYAPATPVPPEPVQGAPVPSEEMVEVVPEPVAEPGPEVVTEIEPPVTQSLPNTETVKETKQEIKTVSTKKKTTTAKTKKATTSKKVVKRRKKRNCFNPTNYSYSHNFQVVSEGINAEFDRVK